MAGRIMRYRGDSQWQDMADAGAAEKAKEARSKVVATLAPKAETLPPSASPSPAQMTFGAIAGRGPSPDRSGGVEKARKASAVKFKDKASKIGGILYDMTGLDHILSGQYLKDAEEFGVLAEPGMGTGVDGRRTPEENDRVTDIAGAFGMDALNVAVGSSPFSRPSNSVSMFVGPTAKKFPQDKAAKAYDLLRKGMSKEEVRIRTGITFDSAGVPRFEVPSPDDFTLTADGERWAKGRAQDPRWRPESAEKTINAPVLFENYPEMRNWKVRAAEDGGVAGSFQPPSDGTAPSVAAFAPKGFSIPKMYPHGATMQTVLGHELGGHGVDHFEGSSFGSFPDYVPKLVKEANPGVMPYDLYRRAGGETWANMQGYRNSLDADAQGAISPYFDPTGDLSPGGVSKYKEQYPRSMQWSQQLDSGGVYGDGPFTFKQGFDPDVHMSPKDRPDLVPSPTGGRKKSSKAPPKFGMADDVVPATNGPRRGRSPIGFGGNGGPNADELLQQAVSTPRKVSQRGGYVGAPPSISTPEQEAALVADIVGRLKSYKGSGTNFYDDFQSAIRNWTGDATIAQKFATASGHTSNQMSPLPNTTHALKAMNQDAVGYPVKAGLYPNASGKKITEDFADGTMSADPKTGQYTYHLLPDEYRPTDFASYAYGGERAVSPGRAVHDTWDKEAFGYPRGPGGKQSAASDTEHNFMDRIYNKVVREARRDPELRARLGTGNRTYERAQADLWDIERQKQEKFDVLPAAKIMQENSALTQVAAIPGPSTGISRKLLDAPLATKNQYTDEMMSAFSDAQGRNTAAAAIGMTPPMEKGLGQWDGMMEPNRAVRYGVGTVGSGADKALDPASKVGMGAVRDWNQIAFGQEGGGITAGRSDGATQASSNLAIIGAPLKSYNDYDRAFMAVQQHFGPDWQYKVVVQPGKNGEVVLKNISYGKNAMSNEKFNKAASQVSGSLSPGGKSGIERDVGNDFRYVQFDQPGSSQYVPDVFKQAPAFQNPDSYHRLFDDTRNNPKLKGTFDEKVIPGLREIQDVSNAWEKSHGIPANTVIDRVRKIISDAGPAWPNALDAAVKKGIIPAFAGAALLGGAGGQFGNEEGVQ